MESVASAALLGLSHTCVVVVEVPLLASTAVLVAVSLVNRAGPEAFHKHDAQMPLLLL